jgi:hypothetical protein
MDHPKGKLKNPVSTVGNTPHTKKFFNHDWSAFLTKWPSLTSFPVPKIFGKNALSTIPNFFYEIPSGESFPIKE